MRAHCALCAQEPKHDANGRWEKTVMQLYVLATAGMVIPQWSGTGKLKHQEQSHVWRPSPHILTLTDGQVCRRFAMLQPKAPKVALCLAHASRGLSTYARLTARVCVFVRLR